MEIIMENGRFSFFSSSHAEKKDVATRELFFRLRYRVYCIEKKWIKKNKSEMEIDAYDSYSDFVLAFHEGYLIAGCRIIDGSLGMLPISEMCKIEKDYVELSRMINHSARTNKEIYFMFNFYKAIKSYLEDRKKEKICALARNGYIRFLKRIFPCFEIELGKRINYDGKGMFVPIKFNVSSLPF